MAQLRHPNVLLFMGACTDPGNMAIVTELLTGGNGEQVLRDPTLALSLYRRLLMALVHAPDVQTRVHVRVADCAAGCCPRHGMAACVKAADYPSG